MAADRTVIAAWLGKLAETLVADALDVAELSSRVAKVPALVGRTFAMESLSIMGVVAESVTEPGGFDAITVPPAADADTLAAATVLVAFGLSVSAPRVSWISRPQARAARSRIVAHGEAAIAHVSAMGASALDLYQYISRLVEIAVLIVSDQAANAVPIVRVETQLSLPSTVLAYQIYGDATRAGSVVDIARSTTPMLMPIAFDALES